MLQIIIFYFKLLVATLGIIQLKIIQLLEYDIIFKNIKKQQRLKNLL